jgi:hypothetical protein
MFAIWTTTFTEAFNLGQTQGNKVYKFHGSNLGLTIFKLCGSIFKRRKKEALNFF